MAEVYSRLVKASELPTAWREEAQLAPDQEVLITVRPATARAAGSPKRFIGAGKGLFASAQEVDEYLQRHRDAGQS